AGRAARSTRPASEGPLFGRFSRARNLKYQSRHSSKLSSPAGGPGGRVSPAFSIPWPRCKKVLLNHGIAVTISNVFGATVLNPFTVAAPIPLCGRTGGLPCKVIIQTTEPAERRCPPGQFRLASGREDEIGPRSQE